MGAILRATAPAETIERASLVEYKERLRHAADNAARTASSRPTAIPLLTSSRSGSLKPSLVVRTQETFGRVTLLWAAVYVTAFWAVALFWWARGISRRLLAACRGASSDGPRLRAAGQSPRSLRDTLLFVRYTQGVSIGLALFAVVRSWISGRPRSDAQLHAPWSPRCSLSVLLIVFGQGPGGSNAKVNLGPVQPIEAIRLLLALFLAGYFARRWELLQTDPRPKRFATYRVPGWLNLPRLDYVLPVVVGVRLLSLFFFLQKDLGPALFLSCVFLAMYAVARSRARMAIARAGAARRRLLHRLSAEHLRDAWPHACQMWQSPWDNARTGRRSDRAGHLGAVNRRLFWNGARSRRYAIFARGTHGPRARRHRRGTRRRRASRVAADLRADCRARVPHRPACAERLRVLSRHRLTLFLVFPVLIMAAGMLGVMPLTGVVTPFLSYGGRRWPQLRGARHAHGYPTHSDVGTDREPFRPPCSGLAGYLGVAALARGGTAAERAGSSRRRVCRQAAPRPPGRWRAPVSIQPARARRCAG